MQRRFRNEGLTQPRVASTICIVIDTHHRRDVQYVHIGSMSTLTHTNTHSGYRNDLPISPCASLPCSSVSQSLCYFLINRCLHSSDPCSSSFIALVQSISSPLVMYCGEYKSHVQALFCHQANTLTGPQNYMSYVYRIKLFSIFFPHGINRERPIRHVRYRSLHSSIRALSL